LVISAIVNVAQNVTEDWPLEVIDHSGRAVNVTLQPGQMVLYESHSILHGRPFPLQGNYYANVFFHYEPVGYTQQLTQRILTTTTGDDHPTPKSNRELFQAALDKSNNDNNNQNDHKQEDPHNDNDLPYYIKEGTVAATRWRQEFTFRRKILPPQKPHHFHVAAGTTTIHKNHKRGKNHHPHDRPHTVAANGDLDRLKELAAIDASSMDLADRNGWKPLHEAVRAGHVEVVRYLIETHHVDVNERTNHGKGGSPLWWAEKSGDRELVKLLKKYGAKAIRPEL
jgi:prolyl 4-hydroxylase